MKKPCNSIKIEGIPKNKITPEKLVELFGEPYSICNIKSEIDDQYYRTYTYSPSGIEFTFGEHKGKWSIYDFNLADSSKALLSLDGFEIRPGHTLMKEVLKRFKLEENKKNKHWILYLRNGESIYDSYIIFGENSMGEVIVHYFVYDC
ncbi:hypothetical protein [Aureivirga sp. CE67]|uniref:hypothetical protein n=1 Tax=Aureivirga sp. CE67 TaxID=1788983 RepID=UPI0018C9612A|nr:hypothetical protein [Aureivirga sp. CE67]